MSPSYSLFIFIVVFAQGALIILYIIQMYSSQPYFFPDARHFMKRYNKRHSHSGTNMFDLRGSPNDYRNERYKDRGGFHYADISDHREPMDGEHLHFGQRIKERRPGILRADNYFLSDNDRPSLLVAILSAPIYGDRRQAIRESWMQDCREEKNVVCKFFTDGLSAQGEELDNVTMNKIKSESKRNRGDLIIMDTPGGANFALRYLSVIEWAVENVDFDFLLRIDDDHYLCLERLLQELPFRPQKRLYWGHVHCFPGVVRVDDGWMIMSADLVKEFWHRREELMCHKYADQAVAMWIYDSMKWRDVNWFGDYRIFHHPPVALISTFKIRKEICHTYLSLHGAYPIEQRVFHMILEKERRSLGNSYEIPPIIDTCPHLRQNFNWKWFELKYHAEPVPCRDNPIWISNGSIFLGRSLDTRERMRNDRLNEQRYEKNKLNIKIAREKNERQGTPTKVFSVVKQLSTPKKEIHEKSVPIAKNIANVAPSQKNEGSNKFQVSQITRESSPLHHDVIPSNVTKEMTSPFLNSLRKELNSSLGGA